MRAVSFRETIELGGIIAILVGLIFVYFEIQQNSQLTRAELASDTSTLIEDIYSDLTDPNFAETYAKGLNAPAELAQAERIQLNAFHERLVAMFGRERLLFNQGVFGEFESVPRGYGPRFFGEGYGKIWWSVRRNTVNAQIVEIIDEALATGPDPESFSEIDRQVMERMATP